MSTDLDQVRDQGRREGKNQYPVINAHMHLINFSMVPNDYYRVFFRLFGMDEKYMEKWWFRLLALMFTVWRTIIHGKFRRLSTIPANGRRIGFLERKPGCAAGAAA